MRRRVAARFNPVAARFNRGVKPVNGSTHKFSASKKRLQAGYLAIVGTFVNVSYPFQNRLTTKTFTFAHFNVILSEVNAHFEIATTGGDSIVHDWLKDASNISVPGVFNLHSHSGQKK